MQFYSFDLQDPIFEFENWKLSFQVITLENIYGIDPSHTLVNQTADGWQIDCSRLSWAGQQQRAPGALTIRVRRESDRRLRIGMDARAPHKIRAVKMLIRDLPEIAVLDLLDNDRPIPYDGILDKYPNPLRLPLLFARLPDSQCLGMRCEDEHARAKRFASYQERMGSLKGTYTIECIHEDDARWFDTQTTVPDWILDRGVDIEAFRGEQLAFNEAHLGLIPWEQRTDMPAWTRDLRLCLTLHGMHWSGFTFNTYDQMLEIIRFAAQRIDGSQILAYLPGWEGRYYWQYGDFRPEPLLGGEEGFARLCAGAKSLGVHVMPMFGGNCANSWFPNFHTFGPSSHMKSATRNVFHGNQPDWDLSRAQDTGWQAWLNPGAPAWQTELTRQITRLADQYDFDAVFIDTVEVWANDPDFNMREGYRQLVDRLRAGRPDFLVTAEDWYDGLLSIFPVFQQSGNWRQVPDWVGRYVRLIGHICDSEPSRGSTGVFEWGYTPYKPLPDRDPYITTIAFTDGTLENAQVEIEAAIAQAKARS